MVSGNYRLAPRYKTAYVAEGMWTLPKVFRWTPTLGLWGGSALVAVLFFADSIPVYRRVLDKLPVIGKYYDDSVDPEDTPF